MKTIKELDEIGSITYYKISIRQERKGTRVVVGMATCGIAAWARPVLMSLAEEVNKKNCRM